MIEYLENDGNLYIESVDLGKDLNSTQLIDYLGLLYSGDGGETEVETLNSDTTGTFKNMSYYYFGGHDAHYSVDRLSSLFGSELMFSSEDGYGRMFVNDQGYKTIASSIMLGGIGNGDTLNIRPYLISEMINFFLDYNPTISITENTNALFNLKNYPNPFSGSTTIEYEVNQTGLVTIDVYDISGKLVKRLVSKNKQQGIYQVSWNGTNSNNELVKPGYYFSKINIKGKTQTEKMILLN